MSNNNVLAPDPAYCCSLKKSTQGRHSVIDRGRVGHHGYPLQGKEGRGRSGKLTITQHFILQPKKTANINFVMPLLVSSRNDV